ncbi:undecaprenyl-diphosphatase [Aneurinibacillus aneurinilyticus]|jgi:undecaprenyl-diphosphatase|uniref:Bacitracin transport permease protein BcrC n=1 Tax=Aneurinibacillus aneurinilyticus ATCC 12856 TaxID=649747 RepID=U1XAN8_ANEAE|nr:undecaprenyl-diphosphatase [Aneurinibacillus aneurinilyticus]ERI11613.1 bacitracin transport permease protein BcrC [Aneurinibacillus aneurinilyticus ATCC 12856]MCI1695409.1 undecaprenyl-diphosphatase [Aneurinibacillus aneurinilyticus]MED0709330.1 undecaprenyl-diphosphatase [Aneurinibacillus aneurinilyticus]MED0726144.1 undecaprenyl-diphosphatase [Aneurinibacillus aneurinilyticus]MED0731600.1 undecaprenyl-diphosphatase [Aneurinibacillus aneurinilyticus]
MTFSQFNIDAFRLINDLGKQYPYLNPAIVFLADYMLYFLCLSIVVYWFTRTNQSRMMVIQAVLAFIFAEILGRIAGQFHSHYQPFAVLPHVNKLIEHDIDNSFPSDHTILFFSVCISFWLVRKKEKWLWFALPFCVAVSRIWVGVHYPIDVVTGAFLGVISALFVYWLVPKLSSIKQLLALYEKLEQQVLPSKDKSKNL